MADFFKIGQAAYGGGADASKAIGEGLEKGRQVFMAYLEGQKAKREKADNITKQYLAQIPNVNAITKIPEWMRADVNNYLVSEKQKYAEVSKQLGSMSSSDPAYMDAVSELQNIKNNFAYLNDQLNQFQEDSKQYVLDVDNDKISEGFKNGEADKYNKTAAVYTGDAKLTIRNGNLFFNVDGKSFNYSRGEIGDYFKKNFGSQTTLLNLAKQVETDARKGFTFESSRKRYEGEIDAVLNKGGKEAVLSMVYDTNPEFITGGGLQTPEIETAILTENYDEAARLVKQELMTGIETEHASIYEPPAPEFNKPTEGDKKYARNTDNIIAAAEQMYLNGKLPDTLPGLTEIPINSREYVINSQIDAQNKAIAEGNLLKNDALTKEELESQYTAPYYTLDLRPIKSIRQAINIAYGADDNQIKSALSALSSLEEYDASKLLFSTQPNLDTPEDTSEDPIKLPPPPDKKTEITQTIQLRGKYAYAKNYLDDMKKLIEEANAYKKTRSRTGRDYKPKDKEERNLKIEQIKDFESALKREFPNLDLSNIQIPK